MNTTSWGYPQNNTDVDSRRHMYRASTSPAAGYPIHPIALMPGQVPQAIDRPNLYFANATRMPIANDVRNMYNAPPPPPVPLYPAHMTSHFQPPPSVPASLPPPRPPLPPSFSDNHSSTLVHRSFTSPPPVPPKPFSAPPIPPQRDYGPSHLAISLPDTTPPVPSLDSPTDEGDIAMALAMSESVSREEQKTQQYLASREEEDLARALEASMLESRRPSLPRVPVSNAAATLSSSIPPLASSQSLPNDDTLVNDACDEETFAHFIAAEQEEQNMTPGMSKIAEANQFPSPSRDPGPPQYPTTDGAISTHVTLSGHTNDMHLQHDHAVTSPSKDLPPADLPGFESKHPPSGSSKASTSSDIGDAEVSARLLAEEQEGRSTTTQAMKTEAHHVKGSAPRINATDLPQYAASGSQRPSEIDNCDDDEAFARWLAAEEVNHNKKVLAVQAARHSPPLQANTLPHYSSRDEFLDDNAPTPVVPTSHRTMAEDEAISRSLDKTYEQISLTSTSLSKDNDAYIGEGFHPAPRKASEPPCYSAQSVGEDDWSSSPAGPSTKRNESYTSLASSGRLSNAISSSSHHGRDLTASPVANGPSNGVAYPNLAPSFYADGISFTASESSHTSTSHSEHPSVVVWNAPQHAPESTPSSYSSPLPSSSVSSLSDHSLTAPNLRLETGSLTPTGSLSRISSMTSLSDRYAEDYVDSDELRPSPSAINLNAFVGKELFNGVSVGFMAPKISSQLIPMQEEMPLVISLPYGKSRPLHLQGPSWRHLLKLMAKLSGTRVEAALSAVAVTKTPPKLRTVIQFVKPHQTAAVWRTIFYFTIDYPSPEPNRLRSVNDLPYSYSLAGVPTLLRDGADTPISKTYTVPASESVPYPTLPINFPELALYLQAALEESRRYHNDNSSGHRKLAKMIKACYPTEDGPQDPPERTSVGGLFKRVIGRGPNRSTRRGANEDTYELVTPFVQDEWG